MKEEEEMKEEEGEGRWGRGQTEVGEFSPVGWKRCEPGPPHGNWQKCQQLAQLLAEKFPKIVSIKISFTLPFWASNAVLGQQSWFGSTMPFCA